MIATAPGKLILTGEYAVLDGAPALVIAVDRRTRARRIIGAARGSSPFLLEVAAAIARRRGAEDPATLAAFEISVDSSAFYDGLMKLGLGSSAAVTVAATARALGEIADASLERDEVLAISLEAHGNAQAPRGARGSGADVAAAVHGGTIVFTSGRIQRRRWPSRVRLIPFFTGHAADTATLVARIAAARAARPTDVEAALVAIADASRAACDAVSAPPELSVSAMVAAFDLAALAVGRLATVTGVDLVPRCVTTARSALAQLGGTAKTTGAGGGDVAVAVIPDTADVTAATRMLIESGCQPLGLSIDETGVDLRPAAQ